jgi:hypothetical protein
MAVRRTYINNELLESERCLDITKASEVVVCVCGCEQDSSGLEQVPITGSYKFWN